MAIKKRIVKGKSYYYLEKNMRLGEKQWRTFSVYIGPKKPTQLQLNQFKKRLQREIKAFIKTNILKPKTCFIDEKTALSLGRVKASHQNLLGALDKEWRTNYLKRQRETFITNTNAIEGSRLTLEQTKKILELRTIYETANVQELEVINMEKCLALYDELLHTRIDLDENLILELHLLLLKAVPNYEAYAGKWRPVNVYIRGSKYKFPHWKSVPKLMNDLILWYRQNKEKIHAVELAAMFHAKFVTIHPFADGNGRIARLLMNYILQLNGFPFADIPFSKRDEYFETQEKGHFNKYKPFVLFLAGEIKSQYAELRKKVRAMKGVVKKVK